MENVREINERIAKNLAQYRKAAGLTQLELAQKINYSDKSVSKWESGAGVPDIYILLQLAKLYGVSVDALVGNTEGNTVQYKQKNTKLHVWIMLLSSGLVWLVATCCFVIMAIAKPSLPAWFTFLYALLANAILIVVFCGVWHYRWGGLCGVSAIIWTSILCLYLTLNYCLLQSGVEVRGLWLLFLLGIPLQLLEIFWTSFCAFLFKRSAKRQKAKTSKV